MASAITFSGFNDIDFNVVLNALMQQASAPLTALQARQTALKSQSATLDSLTSRLNAVRAAAAELDDMGSLAGVKGTSSDAAAVSVSAGSSAGQAEFDVIVQALARAQVTASATTAPDANSTIVVSSGAITIGGVEVSITADTTLQGLAEAINAAPGIGVTATVIKTADGAYRLAFTSKETGAANAFTIENNLAGGIGIGFTDTDADGVSGDSLTDNAVQATDAQLLVNNLPVTSSTNTINDLMPGVTVTALKADPTATVHVSVAPDSAALVDKVQAFVSAYNAAVDFFDDQRVRSNNGEASAIGREPVVQQLRNRLRAELLGAHGTAALTRLSEAGVEFNRSGRLELDRTLFDEAVATDEESVRALFGAGGGVFPAVTALLDEYTQASGFIRGAKTRLSDQAKAMDTQIGAMQTRLEYQRVAMQKEFIAADQAMSRLKDQMNSLSGLGSWG